VEFAIRKLHKVDVIFMVFSPGSPAA